MTHAPKKARRPAKPYAGFPLTPHPNGQWCKKIRGKVHFFGVWADPMAALQNYNNQAADLHAGRQPRVRALGDTPTLKDLGNSYLAAQAEKAKRELITASYFSYCTKAVKAFAQFVGKERRWDDLRPADFGGYRMHLYDRYGVCAIDRAVRMHSDLVSCGCEASLRRWPPHSRPGSGCGS